MENTELKKSRLDPQAEERLERRPRPRSMTTLKLQWLAERVRKCKRIKEALENGTYSVSSEEVAKAILNMKNVEIRE